MTYLGGGNSPDLVVVGAHEDVGKVLTHLSQNPLIEVLGLRPGQGVVHGGVNEAVDRCDLVLLWQHRDVVLERVGHPEALVADVGNALVVEPIILLGQRLVEAVVEVLVVGEDDMTADVVELLFALLSVE